MRLDDAIERRHSLVQKLWWLILARVTISILLFFARALWVHGANPRGWTEVFTPLLVVCGLTVFYALALSFSKWLLFQARIQFTIDIILVTWLIWTTDVVHSPYIAIYIVVIAASSLFLGPRDSLALSVGFAGAFTPSAAAILNGVGPVGFGDLVDGSRAQAFQSIGLFDIAFLVVGLLSARLAERQSRSDVRLQVATQSLANLRALHERIVESIRSGVVTTDLEGRVFTFNTAAQEITHYSDEAIRGKDASILFSNLKDHVAQTLSALQKGDNSPRFETSCLTSEGMRLRLGYSISPLSTEAGETTGMVITFQDLTQVRRLEETSRRQDRLAAIGSMAEA